LRELVIQSLVQVIIDPESKPGQITAAAKSAFLTGGASAHTAGIVTILLGAVLVFFFFNHHPFLRKRTRPRAEPAKARRRRTGSFRFG
jgi:hypothetical protein